MRQDTRYGRRYNGRYDDDYQDPYIVDNRRFDRHGFDQYGFDRNGFDQQGFDREGFDIQGFDRDGYDQHGFHMNDYDQGNPRNIRIVRGNNPHRNPQYPHERPDRNPEKPTRQPRKTRKPKTRNKKKDQDAMIVCKNCGDTVELKDYDDGMDMCVLCVADNNGPGFFATRRDSKPLPLSTWAALIFIGMVIVGALFR